MGVYLAAGCWTGVFLRVTRIDDWNSDMYVYETRTSRSKKAEGGSQLDEKMEVTKLWEGGGTVSGDDSGKVQCQSRVDWECADRRETHGALHRHAAVAPTPPTVRSIAGREGRCGEEEKLGTVWDSGGPELERERRAGSEIDREGRYDGVTVTGVTIRDGGI
ncbi:hypothetical protein BC629DRAFT_1446844 [Irpex lacteus]|nr:hypothetical protein BC629DRAFT_1446844 [Irpex lacteus]